MRNIRPALFRRCLTLWDLEELMAGRGLKRDAVAAKHFLQLALWRTGQI
jgi:hypothetical protein